MNDPTVSFDSRSIYRKEVDSLGELNLTQHYFSIGLQLWYEKLENDQFVKTKVPFDIPKHVGRFMVVNDTGKWIGRLSNTEKWTYTPLTNCTGLFNDVNEEFGEREQQALKNGHCLDTNA